MSSPNSLPTPESTGSTGRLQRKTLHANKLFTEFMYTGLWGFFILFSFWKRNVKPAQKFVLFCDFPLHEKMIHYNACSRVFFHTEWITSKPCRWKTRFFSFSCCRRNSWTTTSSPPLRMDPSSSQDCNCNQQNVIFAHTAPAVNTYVMSTHI